MCVCVCVCVYIHTHPAAELLDHIIVLVLVFWGPSILFSIEANQQCTRAPLSPHSCKHLLFVVFLLIAILTGVTWHITVVLTFISLTINNFEHFFMCLLAIYMSSLEKCLFRSSAFFFFGLGFFFFFLILSYMSCLYILGINSLLLIEFVNVLSHSIGFLSFFVYCFFGYAKAFMLN